MHKKVLLFSRDPGGANTIIPLIKPLQLKGYEVKLYGKDFALKRYKFFGFDGVDLAKEISDISFDKILGFIQDESPSVIITGTSADDMTEKYMWLAAKQLGIHAFAILDNWMNYGVRFSEYGVSNLEKYKKSKIHKYLPSKIFVMDKYAKTEMVKDGIYDDIVEVTGQPYFELLTNQVQKISKHKIEKLRNSLAKDFSDFVITFVSEDIENSYGADNYLGYTEKTIFNFFMKSLEEIISYTNKKITVVIKLHPKENRNSYNAFIADFRNKKIKILVEHEINSWDLVMCSDFVCGMVSMFLLEAMLLNKPIISIQIGLTKKNSFVLDQLGILKSILDQNILTNKLKTIIVDGAFIRKSFEVIKDPVKNVIYQVEKVLKDISDERKSNY